MQQKKIRLRQKFKQGDFNAFGGGNACSEITNIWILVPEQLCPTRGPQGACGPVEGFVWPS